MAPSPLDFRPHKVACRRDKFCKLVNEMGLAIVDNALPGGEMFLASKSVPFHKPGGFVRPITIGDLIY